MQPAPVEGPSELGRAVVRRVLAGLATIVLGQGLVVLIQFVGVPIFLQSWGLETYGEWLILVAVPVYLSISDLGFAIVAGNQMTVLMARGDREGARALFHGVSTLLVIGSAVLIALVAGLAWLIPIRGAMSITQLSERQTALILTLLAGQVVITLQAGMLDAGFRAVGRFPLGALCRQAVRVAEVSATVAAAALGATPVGAAATFAAVAAVGNGATWFVLRNVAPILDFRLVRVRGELVRKILRPALAYTAFPIGNALSIQGMVLVIGGALGPLAVVVFSTTRQLSRFAQGIMYAINQSVWPEITAAFAGERQALARNLHRRAVQGSILISVAVIAVLLASGDQIMQWWTRGEVEASFGLLALLLLVIGANSLWFTSSVVLSATNNHQVMAVIYLVGTALALGLGAMLLDPWGLEGAAAALLAIDVLMVGYVLPHSLALVQDTWRGFLRAVLSPRARRTVMRRVVRGRG